MYICIVHRTTFSTRLLNVHMHAYNKNICLISYNNILANFFWLGLGKFFVNISASMSLRQKYFSSIPPPRWISRVLWYFLRICFLLAWYTRFFTSFITLRLSPFIIISLRYSSFISPKKLLQIYCLFNTRCKCHIFGVGTAACYIRLEFEGFEFEDSNLEFLWKNTTRKDECITRIWVTNTTISTARLWSCTYG